MSDAKRLLAEASERPWTLDGDIIQRPDGKGIAQAFTLIYPERPVDDPALIVYAVNRLPDYEAAVGALDVALKRIQALREGRFDPTGEERDQRQGEAALARLREKVPA